MRTEALLFRLGVILFAVALVLTTPGCREELGPDPVPQYTLTITSTSGGSVVTPGEGAFVFGAGTLVNLVAVAEEGYRFVIWTDDVETIADIKASETTIIMEGTLTITANFVPEQSMLLTITSTDGGQVTTPGEGWFTYPAGDVVDLVALAEEGCLFIKWTGDVDTVENGRSPESTITMNGDYSITAGFARPVWNWHDLSAIEDSPGGRYALMNDLDSGTAGYADLAGPTANGGRGWQPIGTWTDSFSGSFDGQGLKIRGLFIMRPDQDYVGLFGCVGPEGLIEDACVVDADVTGLQYVGILTGANWGTIRSSRSAGSLTGSLDVGGLAGRNDSGGTVSDSCSTAAVTGYAFVGGLVGSNRGNVETSHAAASVVGHLDIGGLVGLNEGAIAGSYSGGSVNGEVYAGGLVGLNAGIVDNSYSTAGVTADEHVGGLLGGNAGTVTNCFWDTEASGMEESAAGTGKTTAEMKNIITFTGAGWDIVAVAHGTTDCSCTWNIVHGHTYPFLSWEDVA